VLFSSDDRVTTIAQSPGLPAAPRRRRGLLPVLCCALLCGAAMPALAQDADAAVALPVAADVAAAPSGNLSALLAAEAADPQANAKPRLSARIQDILSKAVSLLGTPYRWGGTSPEAGFDCSGLVGYVFRTALGMDLPRVSRDQAKTGELISDRAALVAGDLVFFGRRGRVDHVGIYVGEGRFLHAPSTGKDVRVDSLANGYWSNKFMQARRVAM
jgi:cell wall-associated NlpC family hydrolase